MQFRISKKSEVPVRQQLTEQVYFLIATGRLKSGEFLPSVRALARQLCIHHNTVSEAYQDLVQRGWLVRRRGSRLMVRIQETVSKPSSTQDLDDFINAAIEKARERGFSLQELRGRVRERLMAQPPDHILVVEKEDGLRRLIQAELRAALGWAVEACSDLDLAQDSSRVIGALVVTPQYSLSAVSPLVPKSRPPIAIAFNPIGRHEARIKGLREPSVIAVVSVSETVHRVARSLFGPAQALGHTLSEYNFPLEQPRSLRAADLVFCDSLAFPQVKHPRRVHYRLVSQESLAYLSGATR